MSKKKILGLIIILLAAAVWGLAFVAQDTLASLVEPFTVNTIRNLFAGGVLLVVSLIKNKITKTKSNLGKEIWAGVVCGLFLAIGMNLQQFAITLYPNEVNVSGRVSFLTALYVVLVPIFGKLIFRKEARFNVWIAAGIAAVGVYFLCFTNGFSGVYFADWIALSCAAAFALQIIFVSLNDDIDSIRLSSFQFLVAGIVSGILMLVFEKPSVPNIIEAVWPLVYLAAVSSLVGFTFQVFGTKLLENPTVASIGMSMESVFAAIFGALLASELLSVNELIGCLLMLGAIVFANLTFEKKEKRLKKP